MTTVIRQALALLLRQMTSARAVVWPGVLMELLFASVATTQVSDPLRRVLEAVYCQALGSRATLALCKTCKSTV